MIATSTEQSRRLLELGIKMETADMIWTVINDKPILCDDLSCTGIPSWSLSALLALMPVYIFNDKIQLRLGMDKGEYNYVIWYEDFDGGCIYEGADFTCANLIDAAVEMVVWLCKNGYLGKEEEK